MPSQCTPTLLLLRPLSSGLSSLPFLLSFFVCICPSISVPVLVLAMCRLTDGPLFAVLSYLSGGGVMCLEWLLPSSLWPSRGQFSCRSRPGPKPTLRLNWRHLGDAQGPFMILGWNSNHTNSEKLGLLQRKCNFLETVAVLFELFRSLLNYHL